MSTLKRGFIVKLLAIFAFITVFFYCYLLLAQWLSGFEVERREVVSLQVGEAKVQAEVAATQQEQAQGLSNRDNLEQDKGMYFILGVRKESIFVMREVRFPLDIIWIDNGKIVGIEKNAPVPTTSSVASFRSPVPVTHVLEVNAGFSDSHGLKIGDSVVLVR